MFFYLNIGNKKGEKGVMVKNGTEEVGYAFYMIDSKNVLCGDKDRYEECTHYQFLPTNEFIENKYKFYTN